MADGEPPQKAASSSQNKKKEQSKLYSHFMYKAIILTIFLVIIPLFPSEAPDVISPSIFSRWWELLHLVFVGIAVSYGLFSRKNEDGQTDNNIKFDTAHSYVSKLLQVPPVFDDDDVDTPTISDHNLNKVQTWNSQYYRNEPVVVVAANTSSVVNNNNNNTNSSSNKSGVTQKPLLLPVRSLKCRVPEEKDAELRDSAVYNRCYSNDSRRIRKNDVKLDKEEDFGVTRSYARSNSSLSSKASLIDSRKISRNDSVKSRSGVRNEFGLLVTGDASSNSSSRGFSKFARKPSGGDDEDTEERKEKVVLPSPIPWRSRSGSIEINRESLDSSLHSLPRSLEESGAAHSVRSQSSSPKELSPSPSMSSPRMVSPAQSVSLESLAISVEDLGRRKVVYGSHLPPPPPPPPPPPQFHKSPILKANSSKNYEDKSNYHKDVKRSAWSVPKDVGRENKVEPLNRIRPRLETKARNGVDSSSMGRSVRTFRAGEMLSPRQAREYQEEEKTSEDIESDETEMLRRKPAGYNRMSKSSFSEFPKETRDFLEQVMVRSYDDSESEGENYVETPKAQEAPSDSVDEGPDVDKKADEFIAKFREQIRLQRIESIKRSTGQIKTSTMR